ncbi:MAG: SPFH domain-containing protein [Lachnospiraceae bacterium]|nr:SPFH domain-containing protein [Lachnospiraceae bacterium]
MGLIQAAKDAVTSMMADQWREYFYCDSLSDDVLMVKGQKRVTEGRNSNTKGIDNIISNGSIIAVNEGQCMIIVDQGGIVEFCADAGQYVYDTSTEPSFLYGSFGDNVKKSLQTMVTRFTFGGNTAKDQRVYFFNTKEIKNNLYGTANPIPFRIVDRNLGLDIDTEIRCNGSYSFKISNPPLFYKNVCGNVTDSYKRSELHATMKAELVTALQPVLAKLSAQGIRYSEIPGHTDEITKLLNEEMTELWLEIRGIEVVKLNMSAPSINPEILEMINDLQKNAVLRNPGMAAAAMVAAQTESMKMGAEAMKEAAGNTATGPMLAFAGMNMASMASNANMANFSGGMGVNAGQLFQMDAQNQGMNNGNPGMAGGFVAAGQTAPQPGQTASQPAQEAPAQAPILGWTCGCGTVNQGKFCTNCGSPKPSTAGWTCSCGAVNQGKFCQECGKKKPEGAPLYKCDKCGWEPEDPMNPPKFCPECGDIFDDNDKQ